MHKKIKKYLDLKVDKRIAFAVFRTDRLGDTVLSIPVAQALKHVFPSSRVVFFVRKYTRPVLDNNPFIDDVIAIDDFDENDLIERVRKEKFDISISLIADKFSAKFPFKARIPIRIGSLTKLRSIFMNIGLFQFRSKSIKQEAEYNLDLLKPLGINGIFYPKIFITEKECSLAEDYLKNISIFGLRPLITLHPGSGGSAKEWGLDNFFSLIKALSTKAVDIFITGSKMELDNYQKFIEKYDLSPSILMQRELDLRSFLAVISKSSLFISNSTGPLHCAVSLGVNTLSFFPNKKNEGIKRWGPFNANSCEHLVFTPKTSNEKEKNDCMNSIDKDIVLTRILEKVGL